MDVSSISSQSYVPQVSVQNPVSAVSGQDANGDNDGSSGVRRSGGRGQFFSTVFQALQQAGVTLPSMNSSGGNAATTGGGTGTDSGTQAAAPSSVQQALHAFMHSLFQAMNQAGAGQAASSSADGGSDQGNSQAGSTGSVSHHHGGHRQQFAADAQQLLQSLSSGNATAGSTPSSLDSSFQNLLQALGTSSSGGASQPTLQSFMQNLVQDLGGAIPQASGNLHSAQA